jgi:hypothetical protein
MGLYNAAKMFRHRANVYLEMMRYARDERQRQILSELFEDSKTKAKLFEDNAPQITPSHIGKTQLQ